MDQAEQQNNEILQTLNLATEAHNKGNFDEAEKLYLQVLDAEPNNFDATHLLGAIALQRKDFAKAASMIQKAIEINPNFVDPYINLGYSFRYQGKLDEALETFRKILAVNDSEPRAYFWIGNVLKEQGKLAESLGNYIKATELNPNYFEAYNNWGNVLKDLQKYDQAIEAFNKAVAIKPDFAVAFNNLGTCLYDVGRLGEALEVYKKAITLMPNHGQIFYNLANTLKHMGRNGEAVAMFERALELSPGHKDAEVNLAFSRAKIIPAWHFTMLADEGRNEAYRKAIEKVVNKDSVVLDIGTGSGLLSMMAAKAGAKKVIGCEMLKEIADTANQIVLDNGLESQVKILNKKSQNLQVVEDMGSKANILVSEILEAGLLGEGVLPAYRHAIENLVTEDVKILPAKAKVFASIIEAPKMKKVNPIDEICGFDLSAFNKFNNKYTHKAIFLGSEEHVLLTDKFEALEIDFANLPPFAGYNNPNKSELEVKVMKPGQAHGIVFWFDLYLDDEIVVSSGVDGELDHWGQAMIYFEEVREVKPGDSLKLELQQTETQIFFELLAE